MCVTSGLKIDMETHAFMSNVAMSIYVMSYIFMVLLSEVFPGGKREGTIRFLFLRLYISCLYVLSVFFLFFFFLFHREMSNFWYNRPLSLHLTPFNAFHVSQAC